MIKMTLNIFAALFNRNSLNTVSCEVIFYGNYIVLELATTHLNGYFKTKNVTNIQFLFDLWFGKIYICSIDTI